MPTSSRTRWSLAGLLAGLLFAGCQTAAPATQAPTSPAATATPTLGATPSSVATAQPTEPAATTAAPADTATAPAPNEVPLTVELQFCSLEEGRDDFLALLDQLDAAVATQDWEGAHVPAGELANWSFGWRAYIDEPVKSFPPTVAVAAALALALDALDVQITDIQGYTDVAGRPPPSAVDVTAATTGMRAAIGLISEAIAAVPELACGVGVS